MHRGDAARQLRAREEREGGSLQRVKCVHVCARVFPPLHAHTAVGLNGADGTHRDENMYTWVSANYAWEHILFNELK